MVPRKDLRLAGCTATQTNAHATTGPFHLNNLLAESGIPTPPPFLTTSCLPAAKLATQT